MTANLEDKLAMYREYGIPTCFGGTLFEVVVLQNKFDAFRTMLLEHGLTCVEVSCGSTEMDSAEKSGYIRKLAQDFAVLSEVGSKDASVVMSPDQWVELIQADLDAGAWKVITEARESGTSGIYQPDGAVRSEVVGEIVTRVDLAAIVFEAPQKAQQVWLIEQMGHQVNLGNIAVDDVIAVETLRLGLRGDTVKLVHTRESGEASPPHPGALL